MKVKIDRADYDNLLQDYPCLNKYKDDYDGSDYKNTIITKMSEDEFWNLAKELMTHEDVVIGYADNYDKKNYGIDMKLTIYDYYLE